MIDEWEWSEGAAVAWTAVVWVVVVVGGGVNAAVLVHWFSSHPTYDTPIVALHVTDFFMCVLAAPLRYTHTPPIPSSSPSSASDVVTPTSSHNLLLQEPSLLSKQELTVILSRTAFNGNTSTQTSMNDITANQSDLTSENITSMDSHIFDDKTSLGDLTLDTISKTTAEGELITRGLAHAVVLCVCLASLHVVVTVALYRLALLWRCPTALPILSRLASPVLVLMVAVVGAGLLVGSLHATSNFTAELPLLGLTGFPSLGSFPPAQVIGFLFYVTSLCGTATLCYILIIAVLVHQGRGNVIPAPSALPGRQLPSCHIVSSEVPSSPETQTVTQGYGHGRTVRACMTVISVLVTLLVCWVVPVSLALYAVIIDASMTPVIPYSDALLLLSGLIHPFMYGEGWAALAACVAGLRHTFSSVAYRLGVTKPIKTRIRATHTDREEHRQGRALCCWPCRKRYHLPDAQFSEAATFVNSFSFKRAVSRQDPEQ
ncbi:uncharacterized protein [Cherax quadricarinatus]|nr:uncharacterized protein LOC128688845 [Cherax quadricarinatus]